MSVEHTPVTGCSRINLSRFYDLLETHFHTRKTKWQRKGRMLQWLVAIARGNLYTRRLIIKMNKTWYFYVIVFLHVYNALFSSTNNLKKFQGFLTPSSSYLVTAAVRLEANSEVHMKVN